MVKKKWCLIIWMMALLMLFFNSSVLFTRAMTIRVLCWEGYTKPYVEQFKELILETYGLDLKIEITNVSNPAEFWDGARGKQADLISPAHNIPKSFRWKFIDSGVVLPVNLNNIPNYKYLLPILQKTAFVTEAGNVYAVPYTMGTYGLAYNAATVQEPKSWNVLWQEKTKGRYTVSRDYSDCNIYTSALALGASYDDLYDVDKLWEKIGRKPLQNKIDDLAIHAFSLWEGTADPDDFSKLDYAATWGHAVAVVNRKGGNWKMAKPAEGSTVWVDHWLITHAVKNDALKKRICEEWINFCLGAELQVGVIRNWGVSPVVTNINDRLKDSEVQTFNVGNSVYWEGLSLWRNQKTRTQNGYINIWERALEKRKKL